MFPLGEIVMKIEKLLVSSSMLAAMCERTSADNLKLLEPFVLVCLIQLSRETKFLKKKSLHGLKIGLRFKQCLKRF